MPRLSTTSPRERAMLDSALDCIVAMDADGIVTAFNPAAERTFGYRSEEVIGRSMADVIVPESLREGHRTGLRRLLDGGEPRILDKRLELTGMRSDGTEIPVELTVTRMPDSDPPEFTGFIRDISERVAAAEQQRLLRRRLVGSADQERRRLVRDLHDGAQQSLVAVAMNLQLIREQLPVDPDAAARELDTASHDLLAAVDELRELARGIHPATLTAHGLLASIQNLGRRSPFPVRIEMEEPECSDLARATAYFVTAEALTNAAKHAEATATTITLTCEDGTLTLEIRDDGNGGARPEPGSGLSGLSDRVMAIGGDLFIDSPAGEGTTIKAVVPSGS